jgi:hypothetical protein
LERGDYRLSLERLRGAIQLRPGSVQAHRDLARAYRLSGRKEEAETELKEVARLERNAPGHEEGPPYLFSLFFNGPKLSPTNLAGIEGGEPP